MPRSAEELLEFARRVQGNAYAPYSDYPVGAALEDDQGRLFLGVNVENISFGGTICAERSAITAMVSAGSRRWRQIAVVTRDGNTPCGMCRQVLAEFADPDALIICASATDETGRYRIGDLLPHAFDAAL